MDENDSLNKNGVNKFKIIQKSLNEVKWNIIKHGKNTQKISRKIIKNIEKIKCSWKLLNNMLSFT